MSFVRFFSFMSLSVRFRIIYRYIHVQVNFTKKNKLFADALNAVISFAGYRFSDFVASDNFFLILVFPWSYHVSYRLHRFLLDAFPLRIFYFINLL